MTKKVYYAGFYDRENSSRMFAVPAVVKMNYIIESLNEAGFEVEIISPSFILKSDYQFDRGGKSQLNEKSILWLPPSFGAKTKIGKYFGALFSFFLWFCKLLSLKKSDILLVYHAPVLSYPVRVAKWLRKFQLILEVEEIYTYAFNRNIKGLKKELDFINSADKYILVNDLISDALNLKKKEKIICYGPYRVEADVEPKIFDDNKTHIVYAGSFSKIKGGSFNAVEAAKYLPENYVMHILGFGDNKTEQELKQRIQEINLTSSCKVIFEGEKHGNEYYSFMRGCHLGLNPQKWGDYMLYAYPSKVLVYLGLALNVVTSPLKTLLSSTINDYLNYTEDESSQALAQAIINAHIYTGNELKNVGIKLHSDFIKDLKNLIEKL